MSLPEEESVDFQEVEKCLKDAELFYEDTSKQTMLDYYKAIKQSKTTASQEMEQRKILENTEKNCKEVEDLLNLKLDGVTIIKRSRQRDTPDKEIVTSPRTRLRKKLESKSSKENQSTAISYSENQDSDSDSEFEIELNAIKQSAKENFSNFNPFDCPPMKHPPLKRIFRKLKYEIPVLFSDELSKLSVKERAKQLYEYHSNLVKMYKLQQSRSRCFVKLGKPILPNARFNGYLDKHPIDADLSNDESEDTKVDVVSDFDSNADDFDRFLQLEKWKETSENIQSGTALSDQKLPSDEQTKDISQEDEKNETNNNQKLQKTPLSLSTRKRPKKLTNEEIIKRSKLFKDMENESSKSSKNSEKEENSEESVSIVIKCNDKEPEEKGGNRKRSNSENEDSGWIDVSKKKSRTTNTANTLSKRQVTDDVENVTHAKVVSELSKKYQKQPCPICNELFFQSDIAQHASNCEAFT